MHRKQKRAYLTKDEQHNLIWLYQATLNSDYLLRLIYENEAWLKKIVADFHKRINQMVTFQDLMQEARCGFIKGVLRFDVNRDVHILTYATLWVKNELFTSFLASLPVHVPAHRVREIWYENAEVNKRDAHKSREERISDLRKTIAVQPLEYVNTDERSNDLKIEGVSRDYTYDAIERHLLSPKFQKALDSLDQKDRICFEMMYGINGGGQYKCAEIEEITGYENAHEAAKRAKYALKKSLKEFEVAA